MHAQCTLSGTLRETSCVDSLCCFARKKGGGWVGGLLLLLLLLVESRAHSWPEYLEPPHSHNVSPSIV